MAKGDGRGGARPGSGRKPLAIHLNTAQLARKALLNMFGSEEKAFEALLKSGEPSLVKWVYDHGYGKPPDKPDDGSDEPVQLIVVGYKAPELPEQTDEDYDDAEDGIEDIQHEDITPNYDSPPQIAIQFQPGDI